ncbi:hypothetical protein [Alicyclobacillus macrosporangiidus]|nr:hypothetical protein [Alicyclobacillus macrosporangiidus]
MKKILSTVVALVTLLLGSQAAFADTAPQYVEWPDWLSIQAPADI